MSLKVGLLTADLNKTKIELLAADSDIQATLEDVNSTLKSRVCISISYCCMIYIQYLEGSVAN